MPASVKITHIIWRNGEPRFVPGPALRQLGFKGKDLKHPYGSWYTFEQAKKFSQEISDEANRLRAIARGEEPTTIATAKVEAVLPGSSVGQMIKAIFRRSEFHGKTNVNGRKVRKPLAKSTVNDYHKTAKFLETDHADIWVANVRSLNKPIVVGLLEQIEVKRGLSQARKAKALLSMCYSRSKQDINPFFTVRLPGLAPRVKAASYEEIMEFVKIADTVNRPDIGDMLMLGVCTGQRQSDRFVMVQFDRSNRTKGWISVTQIKTGALVDLPAAPQLQKRLDAARERRKDHTVQYPNICIDEVNQRPWDPEGSHYRRAFAEVREIAAKKYPYLVDFHDQDLRDTAVTWLARAGCTIPEICAITGHSEISSGQVLRHYLARHPEQASRAIDKMVAWIDEQEMNPL